MSTDGLQRQNISRRLLLVDDHDDTIRILSRLLRLEGFDVATTDGETAARAICQGDHFDLAIIDLHLLDGDGTSLMRALRDTHRLPAIAFSGAAMPEEVQAAISAGFKGFIIKPSSLKEILSVIHEVLDMPVSQNAFSGR